MSGSNMPDDSLVECGIVPSSADRSGKIDLLHNFCVKETQKSSVSGRN